MYLKELKKHSRASIIKIGLLKKFVLSDISQPSKFGGACKLATARKFITESSCMYLITNKVVNSKTVYKTAFHMYWYTPLFLSRETDLLLRNLLSYQSDSRKASTNVTNVSQPSFAR